MYAGSIIADYALKSALLERSMEIDDKYEVVIVGAGPGGSSAAKELAEAGVKTLLIEKRAEIGMPVRCGEATGIKGLEKLGIKPWKQAIAWQTYGAYLYAPDSTRVELVSDKPNGYTLERRIFDKQLAIEAANAGAEVFVKAYAKGLVKGNGSFSGVKIKHFNSEKEVKCRIIIGADGIEGKVGRWAGINTRTKLREMTSNVQFEMCNIELENNKVNEFYFGSDVAPGGYLWIFPKGEDTANVGLGMRSREKTALYYLRKFIQKNENLKKGKIISAFAGGVPVQGPLKKAVNKNVLLIGDAARHVDPLTGGGIYNAILAGKLAAKTIAEHFESNAPLENYDTLWKRELEKGLLRSLKVKNALEKMSDEDLNKVAKLMKNMKTKNIDIKELTTSMLSMPKELLSFIKSII